MRQALLKPSDGHMRVHFWLISTVITCADAVARGNPVIKTCLPSCEDRYKQCLVEFCPKKDDGVQFCKEAMKKRSMQFGEKSKFGSGSCGTDCRLRKAVRNMPCTTTPYSQALTNTESEVGYNKEMKLFTKRKTCGSCLKINGVWCSGQKKCTSPMSQCQQHEPTVSCQAGSDECENPKDRAIQHYVCAKRIRPVFEDPNRSTRECKLKDITFPRQHSDAKSLLADKMEAVKTLQICGMLVVHNALDAYAVSGLLAALDPWMSGTKVANDGDAAISRMSGYTLSGIRGDGQDAPPDTDEDRENPAVPRSEALVPASSEMIEALKQAFAGGAEALQLDGLRAVLQASLDESHPWLEFPSMFISSDRVKVQQWHNDMEVGTENNLQVFVPLEQYGQDAGTTEFCTKSLQRENNLRRGDPTCPKDRRIVPGVDLPLGSVIVYNPEVLHRGGANKSGKKRIIFNLAFAPRPQSMRYRPEAMMSDEAQADIRIWRNFTAFAGDPCAADDCHTCTSNPGCSWCIGRGKVQGCVADVPGICGSPFRHVTSFAVLNQKGFRDMRAACPKSKNTKNILLKKMKNQKKDSGQNENVRPLDEL
jgi:hypothetical protein